MLTSFSSGVTNQGEMVHMTLLLIQCSSFAQSFLQLQVHDLNVRVERNIKELISPKIHSVLIKIIIRKSVECFKPLVIYYTIMSI